MVLQLGVVAVGAVYGEVVFYMFDCVCMFAPQNKAETVHGSQQFDLNCCQRQQQQNDSDETLVRCLKFVLNCFTPIFGRFMSIAF